MTTSEAGLALWVCIAIACLGLAFCSKPASAESGVASFYCCQHHGRLTASGERFDQNAMTAAHPSLPFGTKVRVTVIRTGKSVVVRITDRGPARRLHRIIDLSRGAAAKLGMLHSGVAKVRVEVVR